MKQTWWAYLAGLFDGERSVYIFRKKKNPKLQGPRATIKMKEGSWIDIARGTGCGRFYPVKRYMKDDFPDGEYIYWVVYLDYEVLYLLKNLLPYLRIKHKMASDMINAIESGTKGLFLNQNQRTFHVVTYV